MARTPDPVTLSQVVHKAVEAADPPGSEALDEFFARFEDADEPLGPDAAERVAQRIAEEAGRLDPEGEDGPLQDAAMVATYLVFKRDELDHDPLQLLEKARLAEGDR